MMDDPRTELAAATTTAPSLYRANLPILLPQERLVLGTRPHPVVFALPAIVAAIGAGTWAYVLLAHVHPIVHGHHIDVALASTPPGTEILIVSWALLLIGVQSIAAAALYYFGLAVVVTNRRAFLVKGLIRRVVQPIPNASMANARLEQGPLGRAFGFASISLNGRQIRTLRDAVSTYRAMQAAANGVDNGSWPAARRQVIIP